MPAFTLGTASQALPDATPRRGPIEHDATTDMLVAELRQVIAELRRGQDDLRQERDHWRAAHEREQVAHAATQRQLWPRPAELGFWIVYWSSDGSNVCRAAAHSD